MNERATVGVTAEQALALLRAARRFDQISHSTQNNGALFRIVNTAFIDHPQVEAVLGIRREEMQNILGDLFIRKDDHTAHLDADRLANIAGKTVDEVLTEGRESIRVQAEGAKLDALMTQHGSGPWPARQ